MTRQSHISIVHWITKNYTQYRTKFKQSVHNLIHNLTSQ